MQVLLWFAQSRSWGIGHEIGCEYRQKNAAMALQIANFKTAVF